MNKKSLSEIVSSFHKKDSLAVPLATGQPRGLLQALAERDDWEDLHLFCGLLVFPYPLLLKNGVKITSGYYGPLERMLNAQGAQINYLPAPFQGFEHIAMRGTFRVIATTVSEPDRDGFVTFGSHGAAIANPFRAACKNPQLVTIAEISSTMPVVFGTPETGDNKIHIDEIDFVYDSTDSQVELPTAPANEVEKKIAEHVLSLIESGSTLQFGIGAIPNLIAENIASSTMNNFGIHSEMISDGFLKLFESGKISNKNKNIFEDQSVFTFAFGSQKLYDFLDERNGRNKKQAICLPVTVVNDPAVIARHRNFTSINSGLMVDFNGQICSEAIGLRQYSGVGGQLSFVQGAYDCPNGTSIICIKSTANVDGKTWSNIVPTLQPGSIVSTPRHYVDKIITEYGVAHLKGVPDEKRGPQLIAVAHPDFRAELTEQWEKIRSEFYLN